MPKTWLMGMVVMRCARIASLLIHMVAPPRVFDRILISVAEQVPRVRATLGAMESSAFSLPMNPGTRSRDSFQKNKDRMARRFSDERFRRTYHGALKAVILD